jgi:small subunit ribosomal protein S6
LSCSGAIELAWPSPSTHFIASFGRSKEQKNLIPPPANPAGGIHDHREEHPTVSRDYEAVYIFDSTLEDTAIAERLERHQALLGVSAESIETNHWGRRQLAYKIGTRENGYYAVSRFTAESQVLPEFERALKLDDGIVRYLITLHEHEVGAPLVTDDEEGGPGSRDDDDDEEE